MRTRDWEVMLPETFESWLLHRVAQAVEQEEVSGDLLMELQAEIALGPGRPDGTGPVAGLRRIVELLEVDRTQAEDPLTALDLPSEADRDRMLREVAENWLAGQAEIYRGQQP